MPSSSKRKPARIKPSHQALGLAIRELRGEAGMTQAQLAEASDVSEGAIKQLESGRREPSFETVVRLAHGMGVSLSAFDQEPERKPGKK